MLDQFQYLAASRLRMHKSVDIVKNDLATIRTGRATPALVEHISINAYEGSAKMKLSEMATITTMDARTIVITPFDPTQIAAIEKSILEANIGLTPVVDAQVIRLTVPSLTEERRQEYIKLAKTKIEAGKVMVRQVRHDIMSELKRSFEKNEINEDERNHLEKEIQAITDSVTEDIDTLWTHKEDELKQI